MKSFFVVMKKFSIILLCMLLGLVNRVPAQKLPDGYILQYAQNFNSNKALEDFWVTRQNSWAVANGKSNSYLQLNPESFSDSILPANRCILKNRIFGDFILEADVMPERATRNICFLLGLKDSTRYYMLVLTTDPADSLEGVYLVKKGVRKKLQASVSGGNTLVPGTWLKIRVERNITTRTIRMFQSNMEQPFMEVKDYELVMGRLAFGTIGSPVAIDNLTVWAPTVIPEDELP